MMMIVVIRVLCIWLPQWPLQRIRQEYAQRGVHPLPEVLYETSTRGVCAVAARSASAAALGVDIGMPIAEALSLWRRQHGEKQPIVQGARSDGGAWLETDRWADYAALQKLVAWCGQFSPHVALEESPHPECLFLGIGDVAALFGGEIALMQDIHGALRQRGYFARLAVADTLGAAWGVARFGVNVSQEGVHCSPAQDSMVCVPPGQITQGLSPLPIAALRIAPRAIERLLHLGVVCVGQLVALPRASLRSRLGPEVLRRLDQALGRVAEPLDCQSPTTDFQADWESPFPITSSEALGKVCATLSQQTAGELKSLRRGAIRLVVRLRDERGQWRQQTIGLFQPSADPDHWHGLIVLQLEQLELSTGVVRIELLVTHTEPLAERQHRLFDDGDGGVGADLAWGRLVERLAGRLGHQAVVRARLVADAQPERAYRWDALVGVGALRGAMASALGVVPAGTQGRRRSTRKKLPQDDVFSTSEVFSEPTSAVEILSKKIGQRPLFVFASIQPIETSFLRNTTSATVAAASECRQTSPDRFAWQGVWRTVVRSEGPERIETGWWRRSRKGEGKRLAGIRRDYWRVETSDRALWWLFCDLRTNRWYLHGRFS